VEVIIQPDQQAVAQLGAQIIAKAIRANPHLVLGLATGRTMESLYQRLVEMHKKEALDFSLCSTFNLDEYVGLSAEDEHSYFTYMRKHLFNQVNIDLRNTHLPNGRAKDLEAECANYEHLIQKFNGIDLQLLGIGRSGHIGFNEPLSALRSRTRVKALTPTTIKQNGTLFDKESQVPRRAITMGVGTILDARSCLLLATGEEKAEIIAKAVEGPITSMISATAMQLHRKCVVVVDEAAASKLQASDYYRWVFQNEPEWEEFRKK
jgi:glucosamine-6-phosphate deaminase